MRYTQILSTMPSEERERGQEDLAEPVFPSVPKSMKPVAGPHRISKRISKPHSS